MPIGTLISPTGDLHTFDGISDICDTYEEHIPETNQLWEDEWEPQDLEYFEEATGYAMKHGWVEVKGTEHIMVDFDAKLSRETINSLINTLSNMPVLTISVCGPGMTRHKKMTLDELHSLVGA
jgi:hypothetical protein